ncbi:PQQ-dependent sugar dehydrogenase [Neolewinella lacunae]|uniref:PQQ-dependent sugar dehydrogenase n=1 Tax=Neolewinella lacunae TaxID=1517758 RepID=A0A923PF57_9BACT|nr:PQQ-dependent sugar dehydrogenase [Neolewinella lacunae]MBC6992993.1 PQQ-dependent sugar dehydrogenase [Neolewinella lacunae]MDN3635783.1 PQQ-dependent sugar dehydrogenase [Neolewinella lacunae]
MKHCYTLLFLLFGVPALTFGQPVLRFVDQGVNFSSPVDVTAAGDNSDRLFIVERAGRIKVFDQTSGMVQSANYLDISARVRSGGERGLLGLAFHPDFATNGYFYVNYTGNGTVAGIPNGATVISRFQAVPPDATTVSAATETIFLTIAQPFANHNAGDLAFGPDGYLYIPTGDGGSGGDPNDAAQNKLALLGKMLRIDVDNPVVGGPNYSVPPTNPFVGNPAYRPEIWATGLRNPWRISFDRDLGDLWIADVGQGQREEINFQDAESGGGENYGWDCREGKVIYNGPPDSPSSECDPMITYTDPLFDYDHGSTGGQSITGGFVYRGQHADDLLGHYVAADYVSERYFIVTPPDGSGNRSLLRQTPSLASDARGISSFGEDDNGNVYVVTLDGDFYELTTVRALPIALDSWTASPEDKSVRLAWTTTSEENSALFFLDRSQDGSSFVTISNLAAAGNSRTPQQYSYLDSDVSAGTYFYRLRQRDLDGSEQEYPIRSVYLPGSPDEGPQLTPNPTSGSFRLTIPGLQRPGQTLLRIFASDGRLVYEDVRTSEAGPQEFVHTLPTLPSGLYRALIEYDDRRFERSLVLR